MTSTADPLFKVELQGAGDNPGAWHTPLNNALAQMVEGVAALTAVSVTNADVTLTDTQYVSNQARSAGFVFSGVMTANRIVTAPDRKKVYILRDLCTHGGFSLTFKPSGGTGITLNYGYTYLVYMDGAGGMRVVAQHDPDLVTASGTDTYTATLPNAPAAYYAGMEVNVTFTNANTGAATINFNGLGAVDIRKDANTAVAANDIPAGITAKLVHNGTNFKLFVPRVATALGVVNGGLQNTGFTAAVNTRYTCVFGANGTITGPASAQVDDVLILALAGNYTYGFAPNGLKVNSSTDTLLLPGNQTVTMIYTGATDGWV